MKYCSNRRCPTDSFLSTDTYCTHCRGELTPCIQCLCGDWRGEVNPRDPYAVKACPGCGERFTPAYLGRCMSRQLAGMVKEIAGKRDSQELKEAVEEAQGSGIIDDLLETEQAEKNGRLKVVTEIMHWLVTQPMARWESKDTKQLLTDLMELCQGIKNGSKC